MYGNLTCHNILAIYTTWQSNNVEKYSTGDLIDYDKLYHFTNKEKKVKEGKFNTRMIYLESEGYLEIERTNNENMRVILRPKGRMAAAGLLFIQKNDEILHRRIIDFGMLIINIMIVVIAYLALNSDVSTKTDTLKEQITKMQFELKKETQIQSKDIYQMHHQIDFLNSKINDSIIFRH